MRLDRRLCDFHYLLCEGKSSVARIVPRWNRTFPNMGGTTIGLEMRKSPPSRSKITLLHVGSMQLSQEKKSCSQSSVRAESSLTGGKRLPKPGS